MKKVIAWVLCAVMVFCLASLASAKSVKVKGHYRKNGTYVQPHYRTAPDSSRYNNWSTKGNVNPYTGKNGNVNPYPNGNTLKNNLYNNGLKHPGLK